LACVVVPLAEGDYLYPVQCLTSCGIVTSHCTCSFDLALLAGAAINPACSAMNLVEQVKQTGVVGAGGGGFPTHVKLAAKADTIIANVASVQAAVAAGRQVISEAGVLVYATVISRPHPDVYREVV
jgi:hypothetical protein